ncbi:MAG: phospho-N-acetylmuramoyl-pentapeptide-transferase [Chloroflexota bacterium]|nr:MAG: phospho-N-acetylmuramoyl-pentapeptide-transferase [Chloroflexota bacterium]
MLSTAGFNALFATTNPTGSKLIPQVLLQAMVFGVASFTICMFAAPYVIRFLRGMSIGKQIRVEGPQSHLTKVGTPTMGGLLFSTVTSVLTVAYIIFPGMHLSQLLTVGALTSCSALGAVDDRMTTVRAGSAGMRARFKLAWTVIIAIVIVAALHTPRLLAHPDNVWVPSFGSRSFGIWYWPLAVAAIVGTAHAVNLTDGLDGLAAGSSAIAFTSFGVIALLTRNYLYTGEFCFCMVGALLAFLWYNIYPARVFMGDAGSLAIGASLATVALLLNQLLVLPIIGFVYVIVTVSVMLQVGYFKLTGGRRLLRMSPLHNHLQLAGWHENQVTQRFWIVSMLCGVAGVALAFS